MTVRLGKIRAHEENLCRLLSKLECCTSSPIDLPARILFFFLQFFVVGLFEPRNAREMEERRHAQGWGSGARSTASRLLYIVS